MGKKIASFRDLKVWQKGMMLVRQVYQASFRFPKEEIYALTSQLRRSAISIPSNIAEGYGRRASGDYARFLQIAYGSLMELQTQLEIARDLSFLDEEAAQSLCANAEEVGKMLYVLIEKIKARKK